MDEVSSPLRPRLLLVAGSSRAASYNGHLLNALAARLADRCDVDILRTSEIDLPIFNQDLEADVAVVGQTAALHARFVRADALIVASPEHNGQLPAFLKNLVDWVSRLAHIDLQYGNPFIDRPVLLCSASTGWSGGAVAIAHARALFGYVGAVVIGDTVCVPRVQDCWTPDGFAFSVDFSTQIGEATARLERLATDFARSRRVAKSVGESP